MNRFLRPLLFYPAALGAAVVGFYAGMAIVVIFHTSPRFFIGIWALLALELFRRVLIAQSQWKP